VQPLLIGGATTSRMHTAVKIAQQYDNGVVHVLDASRSVTVAGSLLNADLKPEFLEGIRKEYHKLREDFANKKVVKQYLPFEESQKNGALLIGRNIPLPYRHSLVLRSSKTMTWQKIAEYIDWQPFFIAWEMHGKFPQILTDEVIGKAATNLYNDARKLLQKLIDEKWLIPRGAIGFWPACRTAPDTVRVFSRERQYGA
jgi:5-methyltetrahydrofolate--homocysteine methyltransferase